MYETVSLNWYSDLYIHIQISTDARLRIHNIVSKAGLCYGSELRILNVNEQKQLEAAQMRFIKPLLGLTRRDKQRNVDVRDKVHQDNIADEIRNYQQNWLHRVNRVGSNRLTKQALPYQPHAKDDIYRPRRWIEQDYLKAIELNVTGSRDLNLPHSCCCCCCCCWWWWCDNHIRGLEFSVVTSCDALLVFL